MSANDLPSNISNSPPTVCSSIQKKKKSDETVKNPQKKDCSCFSWGDKIRFEGLDNLSDIYKKTLQSLS